MKGESRGKTEAGNCEVKSGGNCEAKRGGNRETKPAFFLTHPPASPRLNQVKGCRDVRVRGAQPPLSRFNTELLHSQKKPANNTVLPLVSYSIEKLGLRRDFYNLLGFIHLVQKHPCHLCYNEDATRFINKK